MNPAVAAPDTTGWPHVTEVLRLAGLVDTQWFTDDARERGTNVHLAAQYLDEGDLDRASLAPDVAMRLAQYERFKAEVRPAILAIEYRVVHPTLRYVGTLDRIVLIGGREGVLDIKGPSRAPWQALQVMAYARCFTRPLARWTLHLADESYRLVEHREPSDWNVFQAALVVANWRKAHE